MGGKKRNISLIRVTENEFNHVENCFRRRNIREKSGCFGFMEKANYFAALARADGEETTGTR